MAKALETFLNRCYRIRPKSASESAKISRSGKCSAGYSSWRKSSTPLKLSHRTDQGSEEGDDAE